MGERLRHQEYYKRAGEGGGGEKKDTRIPKYFKGERGKTP